MPENPEHDPLGASPYSLRCLLAYGPIFQSLDLKFYEEWKTKLDYDHLLQRFRQYVIQDFPLPARLLTQSYFEQLKENNEKSSQKERLEKLQNNP